MHLVFKFPQVLASVKVTRSNKNSNIKSCLNSPFFVFGKGYYVWQGSLNRSQD